ncbi:MAG: hypothetical protein R3B47_03235 [Bacteroidia bacterium]
MGFKSTHNSLPLAKFHDLFQRAHWEVVLPGEASLAEASNSRPEACYRTWVNDECFEVSYHEPIDQVTLSVDSHWKNQRYNLFFFLGENSVDLICTIQQLVIQSAIDLMAINRVLTDTKPYCHFTLLELPGEGLYEVGPYGAVA